MAVGFYVHPRAGAVGSARTQATSRLARNHWPARWPGGCNHYAPMTRFDHFWEPLLVVLAFAVVWLGTL